MKQTTQRIYLSWLFSGVAKLIFEADEMDVFFFRFNVPETEMSDFFRRLPKGVLRPLLSASLPVSVVKKKSLIIEETSGIFRRLSRKKPAK